MKPRIFISSTFYDLKYIREDLANFVRSYGYEPVLFEDGDIGYTPGKTLDRSCYDSMKSSDMVILIIGGEYGSAAAGEKKDEFKEYMSVTRNEFRTAVEAGIPVFVMIDKKVMAEYGVYDANYDYIEKDKGRVAFPAAKNINIFRFIREIKGIVTLPIQEFEKSADIKGFVSRQWADMFKNYLDFLRKGKEDGKIEESVNELKMLVRKMSIMVDSVGKNVLKENQEEYKEVINKQEILGFCDALVLVFKWSKEKFTDIFCDKKRRKKFITALLECLLELDEKKFLDVNNLVGGKNKLDLFFEVFDKYEIRIPEIVGPVHIIKEKMELLSDSHNKNGIIEIMTQDKYFLKLVS